MFIYCFMKCFSGKDVDLIFNVQVFDKYWKYSIIIFELNVNQNKKLINIDLHCWVFPSMLINMLAMQKFFVFVKNSCTGFYERKSIKVEYDSNETYRHGVKWINTSSTKFVKFERKYALDISVINCDNGIVSKTCY